MTTDYTTTTGETWSKPAAIGLARNTDSGNQISYGALFAELLALRTQRDELLAALEKIAHAPLGHPSASYREVLGFIVGIAETAIAKVRNAKPAAQEEPTP